MTTQAEDDMRTALRQASAIASLSGERSLKCVLGLAHKIYDGLVLLGPEDRARRIRLIDSIFGSPGAVFKRRQGGL